LLEQEKIMIINFKSLAKTPLREKALLIADAGYEAINIEKTVGKKWKELERKLKFEKYKRIFIVGIGKGSSLAVLTFAKLLGKKLTKCVALDAGKPASNSKFLILNSELFIGTHPLPSKENVKASQEIIKLVNSLKKGDLLITFICGGGSALFCGSDSELAASQTVFKKLTEAGADIFELNTIRKHISEVKGGGLAKVAYPADVISLIASDVLGNDLSMVASGPTVLDKTTVKDAKKILNKYKIKEIDLIETPKDKKYFKNVKNILFVSNKDALSAMAEEAKKLGFKPEIASFMLRGEAKNVLDLLARKAKKGEAVLAGGETTVKLKSGKAIRRAQGKGGRNQEAVLGALKNDSVVLSFASDGHDNTEAAGAIGDVLTLEKAKKMKLNPKMFLKNHDSFNFFKKTGDLVYADKKSFNVADLMIILKEK
jgi:glycerate-2-kinase